MRVDKLRDTKRELARRLDQLRESSHVVASYYYDCHRYLRFSSSLGPFRTRRNLAAKITERYHGVEKGLSLPAPEPGHGASVIEPLTRLLTQYLESYGEDELTAAAVGALSAYYEFNAQRIDVGSIPFGDRIEHLVRNYSGNPIGVAGVRDVSRSEVESAAASVTPEFFSSRHSVRIYDPQPVTDQEIETAVLAARCAPAVCNRQFGAIRTWRDRETIDRLLEIQGGTRGFGENIPALALVTVSLRSYWRSAQRNQGWIDGGLFAMNFMLGLHAQGLGSVALNWSKVPSRDRLLRQAMPDLRDDEAVVMFIGFGHLPDEFRVAASPRIGLGES